MIPLWKPCEIYVCTDPECRSKLLVLEPPHAALSAVTVPRCICGGLMLHEGTVSPVLVTSPTAPVIDPPGERE